MNGASTGLRPGRLIAWAIFALIIGAGGWVLSHVNTIQRLDEGAKAAWAEVENSYQRRADLVPNLVETVKGFAQQEQQVLTAVVEARAAATQTTLPPEALSDPALMQQYLENQAALGSALARLLVVVEAYPKLKSSENFLALQSQLEGTENRIAVARRDYIAAVQAYNTEVRTFPGMVWAKIYGAEVLPTFKADAGADEVPKVDFTQ